MSILTKQHQHAQRRFRKIARKIAQWFRDVTEFVNLEDQWTLRLKGRDEDFIIGYDVKNDRLLGKQEDFDALIFLLGYGAQISMLAYNAGAKKFFPTEGWYGQYWKLGQDFKNLEVNTTSLRYQNKVSALAGTLTEIVTRERFKRIKKLFEQLKKTALRKK